jgi:hypothetical protein
MVNKFLKFNISDNSNAAGILASGPQLVNADDIQSVVYTVGTGIIAITLKGAVSLSAAPVGAELFAEQTYGARVISILCSTSPSAAAIPTITLGSKSPDKAVYAAMTANPGGVQSTVQLGLDDAGTPLQMYFRSFTIATASIT